MTPENILSPVERAKRLHLIVPVFNQSFLCLPTKTAPNKVTVSVDNIETDGSPSSVISFESLSVICVLSVAYG